MGFAEKTLKRLTTQRQQARSKRFTGFLLQQAFKFHSTDEKMFGIRVTLEMKLDFSLTKEKKNQTKVV